MAGERFAVRNLGVNAVVETWGTTAVNTQPAAKSWSSARTRRNFAAAGMSGGVAYVLDEAGDFATRYRLQMVGLEKMEAAEAEEVFQLIKRHADFTKSQKAFKVLALWESMAPKFVKVMPKDYKRVLNALKKAEQDGLSGDDALNAAFEANARDVARIGGS